MGINDHSMKERNIYIFLSPYKMPILKMSNNQFCASRSITNFPDVIIKKREYIDTILMYAQLAKQQSSLDRHSLADPANNFTLKHLLSQPGIL